MIAQFWATVGLSAGLIGALARSAFRTVPTRDEEVTLTEPW